MPTLIEATNGRTRSHGWLLATMAAALLFASPARSQETAGEEADAPTTTETAPADEAAAPEATIEAVSEATLEAAEEPAEEAATAEDEPAGDEAPPAEEAEEGEAAPAAGSGSLTGVLSTLAVIILPIVLGNWLAKRWRLPEQAWRIATILTALTVGIFCVVTGQFRFGPDLAGGITLVYEVADADGLAPVEGSEEGEATDDPQQTEGRGKVDPEKLVEAIKRRIDPAGTKEISIRRYGDAIEIIIPKAGPDDLAFIKRRITDMGQLEFRILADRRWSEDVPTIEKALQNSPSEKLVMIGDKPRAEWVAYDEDQFGANDGRLVRRTAGKRNEALVLLDRWNVTGKYLSDTGKSYGDVGQPVVVFNFNQVGAGRFGKFTGENLANPATPNIKRYLGILLDKQLLSAPALNDRITNSGQITIGSGPNVEQEVDSIVSILNAGSLPAALNKTPISEEQVSPTLGAETVEKGKYAIGVSLIAVLVFILLYYRFAGLVACLALAATLVLVLAAMIIIQGAFTLPGLAGLVLTVGMAVDANVLIFERIREELKKGAGLRMAIRNGFDKATTTIVDANVTTLIAAIVLYTVGTGPIKGFGVTLFLGIVMSMFTAIFCSRTVFDIAERKRWIKSLSFGSILGETNIDFLGKRWGAAVLSLAVIGVGLLGVMNRGENLLNIDFTGGSSVTMVLDQPAEFSEVRSALADAELGESLGGGKLGDANLTVVKRGETGTRYTINCNVDDVGAIEALIAKTFDGKLKTYDLEAGEPEAFEESGGTTGTLLPLTFNDGEGFGENDGVAHDALLSRLQRIAADQGHAGLLPQLENEAYNPGSSQRFKDWKLRVGLPADEAVAMATALDEELSDEPLFPLASKIGGRVAGDMQVKAISAILLSLLGIVAYLWFRFQNPWYGLAAVVALVHDVLVTLGALALSAWVVSAVPPLAQALQLDSFQISLSILAAFITIIGYSLNDTIVVFDRIREVRGKSPKLTAEIINKSINQTLSRTLLTSLTTLIVVLILYFFGGAGIHAFAFALVIGVIVGTYSSIFVASPVLLWMAGNRDDDGAAAMADRRDQAA
ncbi:bifunctional preprotein translocase subunit SecD/SecF [Planctomycetes bacterium MalM25]|nr:bifunctional preprotein translocase subunit SecD/SecF [Planctomycetes bacterium MalM25]